MLLISDELQTKDAATVKGFANNCLAEVTEGMNRHRDEKVHPIADFNKDDVYRGWSLKC